MAESSIHGIGARVVHLCPPAYFLGPCSVGLSWDAGVEADIVPSRPGA
jgi:hypothetical protein